MNENLKIISTGTFCRRMPFEVFVHLTIKQNISRDMKPQKIKFFIFEVLKKIYLEKK